MDRLSIYFCVGSIAVAVALVALLIISARGRTEGFEQQSRPWTVDSDMVIVTAHFTEDVAWLADASFPVVVCTKHGGTRPAIAPDDRCTLPNAGREATSYLKFIYEYYYGLPRHVAFLHGHETAWHQRLPFPMMEAIVRAKTTRFGYVNVNNTPLHDHDLTKNTGHIHTMLHELWPAHFEPFLGPEPRVIRQMCCAQFVVSRERIQSLPRRAYKRWLDMFEQRVFAPFGKTDYDLAVAFEYLWPLIFGDPSAVDTQRYARDRIALDKTLTFVLPLKLTASNNELEYMQMLQLPSMRRHTAAADYIVVVPDEQFDEAVSALLAAAEPPGVPGLRLLRESTVIPDVGPDTAGWYRQQIIKLAAARFVTTREYVTMDADVFLREPLSVDDLYHDGKLRLNTDVVRTHPGWWADSARLLGVEPPPSDELVIGVTPQVLVTEEVIGLIKHVEATHGARFGEVLGRNLFTEYSLYWLYIRMRGAQWDLYARDGPPLLDAIWRVSYGDAAGAFADMMSKSTTPFCLLQSNQGVPPRDFLALFQAPPPP